MGQRHIQTPNSVNLRHEHMIMSRMKLHVYILYACMRCIHILQCVHNFDRKHSLNSTPIQICPAACVRSDSGMASGRQTRPCTLRVTAKAKSKSMPLMAGPSAPEPELGSSWKARCFFIVFRSCPSLLSSQWVSLGPYPVLACTLERTSAKRSCQAVKENGEMGTGIQ